MPGRPDPQLIATHFKITYLGWDCSLASGCDDVEIIIHRYMNIVKLIDSGIVKDGTGLNPQQ